MESRFTQNSVNARPGAVQDVSVTMDIGGGPVEMFQTPGIDVETGGMKSYQQDDYYFAATPPGINAAFLENAFREAEKATAQYKDGATAMLVNIEPGASDGVYNVSSVQMGDTDAFILTRDRETGEVGIRMLVNGPTEAETEKAGGVYVPLFHTFGDAEGRFSDERVPLAREETVRLKDSEDAWIMVASDGLFERPGMKGEDTVRNHIADVAKTYLEQNGGDGAGLAEYLVKNALDDGTEDNVTVSMARLRDAGTTNAQSKFTGPARGSFAMMVTDGHGKDMDIGALTDALKSHMGRAFENAGQAPDLKTKAENRTRFSPASGPS